MTLWESVLPIPTLTTSLERQCSRKEIRRRQFRTLRMPCVCNLPLPITTISSASPTGVTAVSRKRNRHSRNINRYTTTFLDRKPRIESDQPSFTDEQSRTVALRRLTDLEWDNDQRANSSRNYA